MIRHIVLFRFHPDATDEQREAVADGIRSLAGAIPGLRSISCGFDAGLAAGNADFASVAEFDDEAGYLAYASHPVHVALVTEVIRPTLDERSAIQLRLEG